MNVRTISLLILLLGLVACEPSPTPAGATATPRSPTALTNEAVETLVASPSYVADCRSLSTTVRSGQMSYRGVVPGQSTYDDVTRLLGNPATKEPIYDEWLYDDGVNVTFSNEAVPVVETIDVYSGSGLDQMSAPLGAVVKDYGCPELIYAYDTAIDNLSGNYTITVFAYPSMGIEFQIPNYPVSLTARPDEIYFFGSDSLSNYLSKHQGILSPNKAIILSWDQAVVK